MVKGHGPGIVWQDIPVTDCHVGWREDDTASGEYRANLETVLSRPRYAPSPALVGPRFADPSLRVFAPQEGARSVLGTHQTS